MLVALVYFIFLAFPSLLTYSLTTRENMPFTKAVLSYFDCERKGYDPENPCDTSSYEKFIVGIIFLSLSFILLGLYPLINFMFVIDFQEAKKLLKKKFST